MEKVAVIIDRALQNVSSAPQLTHDEFEQLKADSYNAEIGALTGYNCPICKNKGHVAKVRNGYMVFAQCSCCEARASLKRIEKSGLSQVLENYTLEKYQTPEAWQVSIKRMANDFLKDPSGHWFCAAGSVGSGKTHICVAIAGELLRRGKGVIYAVWKDEVLKLNSAVNDSDEYSRLITPLKNVECLYIDDFFKSKKGEAATPGEINRAFEILNARYNRRDLTTIISSEKTIEELIDIDEAIGSRIYERSRGYYVRITGDKNWRLK